MTIVTPEPSDQFQRSVIDGTARAATVSDLAPEDITADFRPHRIYTIDLEKLASAADIGNARLIGWRIFHAADMSAVIESYCDENDQNHRFGGVNRGPYAGGTLSALELALSLPEAAEQDLRSGF